MIPTRVPDKVRSWFPTCALLMLLASAGCVSGTASQQSDVQPHPSHVPTVRDTTAPTYAPTPTVASSNTPTQTPTATLTPVPPTLTPLMQPTSAPLGSVVFYNGSGIGKRDLDTGKITLLFETDTDGLQTGIQSAVLSPDQRWVAYSLSPSVGTATVGLIDAQNGHEQKLLSPDDIQDRWIYLYWTPDSQYLLMVLTPPRGYAVLDIPTPDPIAIRTRYLYSVQSGEVRKWQWECDRLGLSPRSGQLATWCPSIYPSQPAYAVMEWGGEVWFTAEAPETILKVRDALAVHPPWAWSRDGQQVAYPQEDSRGKKRLVKASVSAGQVITSTIRQFDDFYIELSWSASQEYLVYWGRCYLSVECLRTVNTNADLAGWTSDRLGEGFVNLGGGLWHPSQDLLLVEARIGMNDIVFVVDPKRGTTISRLDFGLEWIIIIGWLSDDL